MAAKIFQYLYDVVYNPSTGKYHVIDNDSNNAILGPLKQKVVVADNGRILGPGDDFHIGNAGGILNLNGAYTFVTRAELGGSLQGFIVESSGGQYFFITDSQILLQGNAPGAARLLTPEPGNIVICFLPGTRIATPGGEVAVEDLRVGDPVRTADGREMPVRWIGRQTVSTLFRDEVDLPIRIRAGAIDDNVPCRDLLISPDHALLIDDVLVHAGALVDGLAVVRERDLPATFTYYHVELSDHSLILAENTPAETFIDNADRANFDNWREYQALYPDGSAAVEMPFPRAKSHRQVPRRIRERLASRASALFRGRASAA